MAVLILSGLLVDISRINAGRTIVKRAADAAAGSILAEYGSKLKEGYGIFAIPMTDAEELEDQFEEALACNLSIPCGEEIYEDSTDLFGFRIEKVTVMPIYNLSENSVVKKQILEYMKYRAPAELVEGFMEKLLAVKDVGKMSEAYKQKVGIDKLFGSMDKSQQKLKKKLDGLGNSVEKFVNGFNLNGSWEQAYHSFNAKTANLEDLKGSLGLLDSSIDDLERQISGLKSEAADSKRKSNGASGDENVSTGSNGADNSERGDSSDVQGEIDDEISEIKSRLNELRDERSDLEDACSVVRNELGQMWNEIRYSLTGDYVKANEDAVGEINKIVEKGKKAQESIGKLEGFLKDNFEGEKGTLSKDFKGQLLSELDSLKELVLDGQRAEKMIKDVGVNSGILNEVSQRMDSIGGTGSPLIASANNLPPGGLPSDLLDTIAGYVNISYDYSKPDKGNEKDDPRKGKVEAVKKFIAEEIFGDVNYETAGIEKNDLPSSAKVVTGSFDYEDEAFNDNKPGDDGDSPDEGVQHAQYSGDLEHVDEDMDLYDEEGMFQENALGFISAIGDIAAGEAIALRDSIYLNEYIMGSFKNSVPALQREGESIKDVNLHGSEKESMDTFYNSEVEYILHGQSSQKLNEIMTKGELLLVRFGLNTLHVYTDAKKKTMATSIATTVAGWWTGGAGIPIITNLVLCGWGMGEALIDVKDLMEGKSVPIYKMKGDWRLDIGLAAEAGPKTDRHLYFDYHDYLRLFLLTLRENTKLDRVEDLIQLNIGKSKSGFRMSQSHTYVRIEAEVSMKYLFITRPFIRKELKTGDGRYIYKVLVYEGY